MVADVPGLNLFAQKANAANGFFRENEPLNWDAFLSEMSRLAARHKVGHRSKKHVQRIGALLQRLDLSTPQIQSAFDNYKNNEPDWFEHDLLHKEVNFQVSLLQFEKGEYISHHDHPKMCGAIFPVNGELEVKNFDVLPSNFQPETVKAPSGEAFEKHTALLRHAHQETLRKGNISLLTEESGNIHSVMPMQFSQVIDIFTPAYNEVNEAAARWYQVDETAFYEGKKEVYRAEWYKNA